MRGNGFIAPAPDEVGMWLALSRAVRAYNDPSRWAALQRRGMCTDWSWRVPAEHYRELYDELSMPVPAEVDEVDEVVRERFDVVGLNH